MGVIRAGRLFRLARPRIQAAPGSWTPSLPLLAMEATNLYWWQLYRFLRTGDFT